MERTTEVNLDKLKVGLLVSLDPYLVDTSVEYVESVVGHITAKVRGYVWAEDDAVQRFVRKYPADWWQAFRERWFPRFVLNRWPVVYQELAVAVRAIYPDFRPAIPDRKCRLLVMDESWPS